MVLAQLAADPTAWSLEGADETLYSAAWPWLVRRMAMIVRDREVAEDVSQEALLRLVLEARAGRTPGNPRAWLSRVAFNLAMSHGRHAQVERRRAPELIGGRIGSSPEDEVVEHERFATIRRGLAELAPDDRVMLVLAASGHSGLEIARQVGRSHSTVRVRLHRARRRLRARLEELQTA